MIRTKDLIEFMKYADTWDMEDIEKEEYKQEIVARLQMHDELKEGIKKIIANLCPRKSNVVDK